ncbi:hypothetical protein B0H13DRAFT_2065596, partial [Mycena leptocephala]
ENHSLPVDVVEDSSGFSLSLEPMDVDGHSNSDLSSSLAASNVASVDISLQAHVLPGRGRHLSVVLPFLCITDIDNVVNLMSSAASQQHVWGIREPVLGFVISPNGVVAKLVLSWVDLTTVSHVVHPRSCENNKLDWRLDTAEIPSENFETWRDCVAHWIRDIETSSRTLSSDLPPTPPYTPPPSLPTESSDGDMPPANQSTKKSNALSDGQKTEKVTAARSYRSSSDLARLSAQGFDNPERPDTLTWMFDRVIYLGALIRISLPGDEDDPATRDEVNEINEKLDSYEHMCGFRWSPSFNADSCPVDGALSELRDVLFQQVTEIQLPADSELKAEHREFLTEHMSALLYASDGAFTLNVRPSICDEQHCDWDVLLYHFYALNGEDTSPYVLLEQTIHFSRNELASQINSPSFAEDHEKQLKRNADLCVYALAGSRRLSRSVSEQASIAFKQAERFTIFSPILYRVLKDLAKLQDMAVMRSGQEPRDGICDALLFGAIKAPANVAQAARFITPPAYEYKEWLQNPFRVSTTETSAVATQTKGKPPKYSSEDNFVFPHAVAEYKTPDDDEGKALNQGRMYLAPIDDYPFYYLVTSGKLGAVLMAWRSSKTKQTYLMERNVRTFNISVPVQAVHFATFLLRLRDDQEKLKRRVEERIKEGIDFERLRQWNKSTQVPKSKETKRPVATPVAPVTVSEIV